MISEMQWFMDGLLAVFVLSLAWTAVNTRSLQKGIALFIAFGIVVALIWVRLNAIDLALAEAAIGAGISGALLLTALRDSPEKQSLMHSNPLIQWSVNSGTLILTAAMLWALWEIWSKGRSNGLIESVRSHLPLSGVENPVTAVLVNFRAYDTLLELAVLLIAALGILMLGKARKPYQSAGPILMNLTVWITPLLILVAGYLLWVGAYAPGGAFQAGAILGAAGVLLRLTSTDRIQMPSTALSNLLLVIGVGVFIAVGGAMQLLEGVFLQYPIASAGSWILLIEAAATFAIAMTLVIAFAGGHLDGEHKNAR